MFLYALIWGALYMLACELANLGLHGMAVMLFPVPVAAFWVRDRLGAGIGLIVCACAVALVTTTTFVAVLEYGATAGIGMLVGIVMRRRWSLGRGITLVTSGIYVLSASSMLANWYETKAAELAQYEQMQAQLVAVESSEHNAVVLAWFAFMEAEWEHISLGMLFVSVLMMVVVAMTFLAWRMRARGTNLGPIGKFRTMRTPDWLVWCAIVLALMWFWEQKWPNEVLRSVTWSSAIGLALIYLLNGFSIVAYAVMAVSMPIYLLLVGIALLLLTGIQSVMTVGLFDTWFDFRSLADKIADAQREKRQAKNE